LLLTEDAEAVALLLTEDAEAVALLLNDEAELLALLLREDAVADVELPLEPQPAANTTVTATPSAAARREPRNLLGPAPSQ
jgi:hypothetical protein